MSGIRSHWSFSEISDLYNGPLLELIYKASLVHHTFNKASEVQVSSLISIKTGACPEDCSYCPQAARYHTGIEVHKLMSVEQVMDSARKAKSEGASRLCMGAAWREVRDNSDFDRVLEMVRAVNAMDMEVCCTLGMLSESQASKLAEAGLYAYNHNLDTSEDHYSKIISTRTYKDRVETIKNVRKAGVTVCSGGIIGLGESVPDRIKLLLTLSSMTPQPESVPINALVPVEGTPLGNQIPVPVWDMVRMIATTRIVMPKTVVRLSAGRTQMSAEGQALCFMAGANSIFSGDKLLTTPNPDIDSDKELFQILGITRREAFDGRKRLSDKQATETISG